MLLKCQHSLDGTRYVLDGMHGVSGDRLPAAAGQTAACLLPGKQSGVPDMHAGAGYHSRLLSCIWIISVIFPVLTKGCLHANGTETWKAVQALCDVKARLFWSHSQYGAPSKTFGVKCC